MPFNRFTVLGLAILAVTLSSQQASAQGSRRGSAASPRQLDQKAEEVQNSYLKSLAELASGYEEAGEISKATEMLRAILKIKPDAEAVKTKIEQFEEQVFKDNMHTLEFDVGAGWVPAGILVGKDLPVRIVAQGNYKMIFTETLGPDGVPQDDPAHGSIEGVPLGGLVAMVGTAPSGRANTRGRRNDKQQSDKGPKFTYIGSEDEFKPSEGGPLYLRINAPRGANCTGRIKVQITGNFVPAR